MTDFHTKSFFGKRSGIILTSSAKSVPYMFLKFTKKRENGSWEKPTRGEGKTIKLSIEEMICVLEVLKRKIAQWRGYHLFKETKTEIYFGWEDESREVLRVKAGDYSKKLKFPFTTFLTLLIDHLLTEKIEFATSGAFDGKEGQDKESFSLESSEQKIPKDTPQFIESMEQDALVETIDVSVKIKGESPKALLITLDSGQEFWIPKSTIRSDYDVNHKDQFQKIVADKWIIEKYRTI